MEEEHMKQEKKHTQTETRFKGGLLAYQRHLVTETAENPPKQPIDKQEIEEIRA
jgi:hypothetical protein